MKTIFKNAQLLIFAALSLSGVAQTTHVCFGASLVLTATNSAGLSNPVYSINPGGTVSANPSFTVSPSTQTTYTLYTTGTNSNFATVTTTNTINVIVSGPSYSLVSAQNFSLGCASKSTCVVQITNASAGTYINGVHVPNGGPVTFTLLAPGSSTVLPTGILGTSSNYNITSPGSWSIVVRENMTGCDHWSTLNITANTASPVIGTIVVIDDTLSCSTPTTLIHVTPDPAVQHTWLWAGAQGPIQNDSAVFNTNFTMPSNSFVTTVTLFAKDNNNACLSLTSFPIYHNMSKPNAQITGPTNSLCTSPVILTNQSTAGNSNSPFPNTKPIIALLWEGPSPQPSLALSSTYTATVPGQHTMTVRDENNGCIRSATINIPQSTFPPSAAFAHTVTNGSATFNNLSTGIFSGTLYYWDFGDGNTSTLVNPTHTYSSGGAHLVKLKVNNGSCVDSVIQSITVSGVPCTANSGFSLVPTATAQVWDVIPSYPWNVTAATWNWGDGSTSNVLYTSHQYSAAGMYSICLSVTVSCVASSSTCTSYSIYRTSKALTMIEINVKSPELISGLLQTDNQVPFSWNIIPNPNTGVFYLDLDGLGDESVLMVIHDLTGRVVYNRPVKPYEKISVDPGILSTGMYLLTLSSGTHQRTKRLIINH